MGGFNKDDNQDRTVDLSTCFSGGWIWRHARPFSWPLIHHSLGSYVSSWKIIYSIDEKALMKRHWFWCKYKSNFCPLVYKWSGYSIFRNISLALKGAYGRAICRQFQLRVFPHSYSHRQRISNDPDSGLIPERVSPQSRARSRCLFRRAVSQSLAFYRPTMPHSNVKILVHFRFSHQSAVVRNESTCYVCAGLPCSRSVSSQERPWCGPKKKRSHLWEHGDLRSLRSRIFSIRECPGNEKQVQLDDTRRDAQTDGGWGQICLLCSLIFIMEQSQLRTVRE